MPRLLQNRPPSTPFPPKHLELVACIIDNTIRIVLCATSQNFELNKTKSDAGYKRWFGVYTPEAFRRCNKA